MKKTLPQSQPEGTATQHDTSFGLTKLQEEIKKVMQSVENADPSQTHYQTTLVSAFEELLRIEIKLVNLSIQAWFHVATMQKNDPSYMTADKRREMPIWTGVANRTDTLIRTMPFSSIEAKVNDEINANLLLGLRELAQELFGNNAISDNAREYITKKSYSKTLLDKPISAFRFPEIIQDIVRRENLFGKTAEGKFCKVRRPVPPERDDETIGPLHIC